jgi:hypothetical protein
MLDYFTLLFKLNEDDFFDFFYICLLIILNVPISQG